MSRPSSIVARLRWPMFIAAVVAAFLIGLQVRPPAVKLPAGPDWQASAEELPESLPAPVFRHFQQVVESTL